MICRDRDEMTIMTCVLFIYYSCCSSRMHQTEVEDGLIMLRAPHLRGEGGTIEKYVEVTRAIEALYTTMGQRGSADVTRPEAMSFHEFCEHCERSTQETVAETFGYMFLQVRVRLL